MITYKIIKNKTYGDYRVEQYINGKWENEFDDNWNKDQATKVKNNLITSSHCEYYSL